MPIAFYRKYHFYAYSLPTFLATDITYIIYIISYIYSYVFSMLIKGDFFAYTN